VSICVAFVDSIIDLHPILSVSHSRLGLALVVNNSRTIMRQGAAWVHECDLPREETHRLMSRLAAAVWCFPRSLARHLLSAEEDADDFAADVRSNLRSDLAEDLIAARHKPTRAMYELSCAINEFPLSDWRRVAIDSAATALCDAMVRTKQLRNFRCSKCQVRLDTLTIVFAAPPGELGENFHKSCSTVRIFILNGTVFLLDCTHKVFMIFLVKFLYTAHGTIFGSMVAADAADAIRCFWLFMEPLVYYSGDFNYKLLFAWYRGIGYPARGTLQVCMSPPKCFQSRQQMLGPQSHVPFAFFFTPAYYRSIRSLTELVYQLKST
jgi:hypothetical protein